MNKSKYSHLIKKDNRQKEKAHCPFCRKIINRPRKIFPIWKTEFSGGKCSCGAVFLMDPTGKNMGLLLADALMIADIDYYDGSDYGVYHYVYYSSEHCINVKVPAARVKGSKILFVKQTLD